MTDTINRCRDRHRSSRSQIFKIALVFGFCVILSFVTIGRNASVTYNNLHAYDFTEKVSISSDSNNYYFPMISSNDAASDATSTINNTNELDVTASDTSRTAGGGTIDVIGTSSAACEVGRSTRPARFSNYSKYAILPNVDQLFHITYHDNDDVVITSTTHTNSSSLAADRQQRPTVTCYVDHVGNWYHFAHTMQQVYRCWSLFEYYNCTYPTRGYYQPVLVATPLPDSYYNTAVFTAFRQMGIRVVDYDQNGGGVVGGGSSRSHTGNANDFNQPTGDSISTNRLPSISAKAIVKLGKENPSDKYNGYKMLSIKHAESYRRKFIQTFLLNNNSVETLGSADAENETDDSSFCDTSSLPRIGILDRGKTRKLLNVHDIYNAIIEHQQEQVKELSNPNQDNYKQLRQSQSTMLSPVPPKLFYMENKTFEQQIRLLKDIDILVTPHGAALTSSIFLPPCSSFVEIFPKGYYWDQFYGSLASISNHGRATLYAGGDDGGGGGDGGTFDGNRGIEKEIQDVFTSGRDRKEIRKRNICINATLVIDAVTKMESMWYQCCKDRLREQRDTHI